MSEENFPQSRKPLSLFGIVWHGPGLLFASAASSKKFSMTFLAFFFVPFLPPPAVFSSCSPEADDVGRAAKGGREGRQDTKEGYQGRIPRKDIKEGYQGRILRKGRKAGYQGRIPRKGRKAGYQGRISRKDTKEGY
jgi:hypothetical protein